MPTQSQGEALAVRTYFREWVCVQIPPCLWDSSRNLGRQLEVPPWITLSGHTLGIMTETHQLTYWLGVGMDYCPACYRSVSGTQSAPSPAKKCPVLRSWSLSSALSLNKSPWLPRLRFPRIPQEHQTQKEGAAFVVTQRSRGAGSGMPRPAWGIEAHQTRSFAREKQNNGLRLGKRNSLCAKSGSASFRSVALDKRLTVSEP